MKRFGNLIERIVEPGNMSNSFDDVLGDLKNKYRKEILRARKDQIIERLTADIRAGSFRITALHEMLVTDGPKLRLVHAPPVIQRIGCHAIMNVVDEVCYKSQIPTSAASIKGRGMHYLHDIVMKDIRRDPEGTKYFYKCDIKKFFESIDQDLMYDCVCRYIKDKTLLPILENFIRVSPEGIVMGLRASQCFGNKTSQGEDRYVVSFFDPAAKEWGKFFTASEEMKNILDQVNDIENGFPFETTIVSEVFDGNKVKYKFT